MSTGGLLTAFLICSALLALWFDGRLRAHAPESLAKVVLHCAGGFLAVQLTVTVGPLVIAGDSLSRKMLGLFVIVLPGWTYAFLASLWLLKLLRGALQTR